MRTASIVVLLVGVLCLGTSVLADQTFSSRRTSESEVSKYRQGAYSAYGHRFTPNPVRGYVGPRVSTGSSVRRQSAHRVPTRRWGSRRRSYLPGSHPWADSEFHYSVNITIEEEVSWSGVPPYGFVGWGVYQYPTYGYYGSYSLPYTLMPYYSYYPYRRPIGHRFQPAYPRGGYRPYSYPYRGSGINVRIRW